MEYGILQLQLELKWIGNEEVNTIDNRVCHYGQQVEGTTADDCKKCYWS